MAPTSELKVVMGAMTFGAAGGRARVQDLNDVVTILDIFQSHGHSEVDTARYYCEGTSEAYLGDLNWQARGLNVETKLYPIGAYRHTPESLRKGLDDSLRALKADKVDLWYLHGPDRSIPWEVTLKAVNELHKEGKFNKLGLSNYRSWEVAEIVTLCRVNGWIQPTVYQGAYNAISRTAEPELFPRLRKFGISSYAYNPLGRGFFTGKYSGFDSTPEAGSRFDTGSSTSQWYRARYWNARSFEALELVKQAAEKHGLTMAETAVRWLSHHSELKKECGDAIIICASSTTHIDQNLLDLEKGPLLQHVVGALDAAWVVARDSAGVYWH